MNLSEQDKLTRRGFLAGLIATGVAKGLPLPPGVGETAEVQAGWVAYPPENEWTFVYRLVVKAADSTPEQGWEQAWDVLAQTG